MSKACKKLHEELSKKLKKPFAYERKEIPDKGIYIVFDKSEKAHDRKGRIVYVGESSDLKMRAYTHFSQKTKNESNLRKKIDACLMNQKKDARDYIKDNLLFTVIKMEKEKERREFESRIISTIASCTECEPSNSWLGKEHPNVLIRQTGLWNVQGKPLSEKEVDNFLKKYKK